MKLIDVNKALEKLCEYCCCGSFEHCEERCVEFRNISNLAAVEVIHARKAESAISETGLMCTACYSDIDRDAVFCKYCGAKMDLEDCKCSSTL